MKEFFSRFGDAPLCNNKPERALHIGDFVFPLCYRCMMITIGIDIDDTIAYTNEKLIEAAVKYDKECLNIESRALVT